MYFFTGDEHFGHKNILQYCERPFADVHEMNSEIIRRHNEVVSDDDIVIHAGDFTLNRDASRYIKRLKGKSHVFLRGSHDHWMKSDKVFYQRWEKTIAKQHVVVDHYAAFVWSCSHHGSWQLHGHSHGGLERHSLYPFGKQWDVGVDNNDFYPVSFEQLLEIMKSRPENWNRLRKCRR